MRGPSSGLSCRSSVLVFGLLVGLLVVAGGCRTLRSPHNRWQPLDQPAAECVLPPDINSDGAPPVINTPLPAGAVRHLPSIRTHAASIELAERLSGAGLFGVDCTGRPFGVYADSWRRGPGHALSFRGGHLDSAAVDETRLSGADSARWVDEALVVYGSEEVTSGPGAMYGRLVQPAPDVSLVAAVDDERDLIDQGIDVLVTEDPTVIDYGNRSREHLTSLLPFTRLYVVVAPVGVDLPSNVAGTLASGITAETQAIDEGDVALCASPYEPERSGASVVRDSRGRVLFDETDAAARDLASRLVALSSQGRLTPDQRHELAATAVDQRSVFEAGMIRTGDFLVLRVRAPFPGDHTDSDGCVPLPDALVAVIAGRSVIAVAWVREHAVYSSDVLLIIDNDGLPIARRANRRGE